MGIKIQICEMPQHLRTTTTYFSHANVKTKKNIRLNRQLQDSNLRGQSPKDF